MELFGKLVGLVFLHSVFCAWDDVEDRNSELKDESRMRNMREMDLGNWDGLKSWHMDKSMRNRAEGNILFVDCFDIDMGPIAKCCMRLMFNLSGVNWTIDSVATSPKYVGKPMTKRMADFLRTRNRTLRGHRVRLIAQEDFKKYHWILALDEMTLDYLNKIKPNGTTAQVELYDNYDFYQDGHPSLFDINTMQRESDYMALYHHNLRLATMFFGNIFRCKTCYPIDFKKSEKYWDEIQAKK